MMGNPGNGTRHTIIYPIPFPPELLLCVMITFSAHFDERIPLCTKNVKAWSLPQTPELLLVVSICNDITIDVLADSMLAILIALRLMASVKWFMLLASVGLMVRAMELQPAE